jgi:hypothetical protein
LDASEVSSIRQALESERLIEQEFVAEASRNEKAPKGWPAALVMFHVGMWRERLRNGLSAAAEGRDYTPPSQSDVDPINDEELASGIGTPLADAAARSDLLLGEIIELYERVGDRPFAWTNTHNTTEAVLRNSFTHPRIHMFEYYRENGLTERGAELFANAVKEMRAAQAPPVILGAVLCNLGAVRAGEGKVDEALELLAEGFPMRPDIRAGAADDDDLQSLRGDPRFEALLKA